MPENKLTIRPLGALVAALDRYSQELYKPPEDTIRGVDQDAFMSPLQPVKPMGPPGTEPRGFQYWSGQNMLWTPRPDAEYSASYLKYLATYPLARIAIENVKESMIKASWEIQPRPQPGESRRAAAKRGLGDDTLLKISRFFEMPDREHVWPEWLSPLLEDMLVIDAWTVLMRRTFKNEIVEMPVLRGDSIVRYIDENGWTPMPPQPAYAQLWWGMPLVNLTTDQLVYKPRNIVPRNTVSSQLYGMSPTEQIAREIEVGIKRLEFTLSYYTEGSVPGVVHVVPKGTSVKNITEAMQWMNSELAGNLAARRQWRMIQGFAEEGNQDQIIFSKEPLLADAFDELHVKKIFFAFGVSPQRIGKTMNRAAAQQADEASEVEGMLPYFASLKALMDFIIQRKMGYADYEMVFDPFDEPDPEKQMKVVTGYTNDGLMTLNEGREKIGMEPAKEPEAEMLGVKTATGFVPIGYANAATGTTVNPNTGETTSHGGKDGNAQPDSGPGKTPGGAEASPSPGNDKPNGHGNGSGEGDDSATKFWAHCASHRKFSSTCQSCAAAVTASFKKEAHALVMKATHAIYPGRLAPGSIKARVAVERTLRKSFGVMRRKVKKVIAKNLGLPHAHLSKADATPDSTLQETLNAIALEWEKIAEAVTPELESASLTGASMGALQLEITDEDMIDSINRTASDWAYKRGAELVGMRRLPSGRFVENPDARWAISETTRKDLRRVIGNLFETEQNSLTSVERAIEDAGIFSDTRATMIARTEISRAQTEGNMDSWRESGLVKNVIWKLSADHDKDDECDTAASDGPYTLDAVPPLPLHPNCECALVLNELSDGETVDDNVEEES